jgi:PadR family transcriptional regulator, regulatory protein PadR
MPFLPTRGRIYRDLAAADGLLTSEGTVYPLLNRLRDAGLVTSEWQDNVGERARRYYFITDAGRQNLADFRSEWVLFSATVTAVVRDPAMPRGPAQRDQRMWCS